MRGPRLVATAAPRPVVVRLDAALLTVLRRAIGGDIDERIENDPRWTLRQRQLARSQQNQFAVELAINTYLTVKLTR